MNNFKAQVLTIHNIGDLMYGERPKVVEVNDVVTVAANAHARAERDHLNLALRKASEAIRERILAP